MFIETAMAWDGNADCFTKGSWGWAVPFPGNTDGKLTLYQGAGGGCKNAIADKGVVGTGLISADGTKVTLTPTPPYSFAEVHIDVQCAKPTSKDAPGQYNWNDLDVDLDPCAAGIDCDYFSVGGSYSPGDCSTETTIWFRIHAVSCGPTQEQ